MATLWSGCPSARNMWKTDPRLEDSQTPHLPHPSHDARSAAVFFSSRRLCGHWRIGQPSRMLNGQSGRVPHVCVVAGKWVASDNGTIALVSSADVEYNLGDADIVVQVRLGSRYSEQQVADELEDRCGAFTAKVSPQIHFLSGALARGVLSCRFARLYIPRQLLLA